MLRQLIACFEALDDPRDPCKVEHRLVDILVIAVCAVVAEADSFTDIEDYGRAKRTWLERFLALPNGIPSHDTFRRVFMLLDPERFERCFVAWVRSVFAPGAVDDADAGSLARHVAIDGKRLRRSFDHGKGWPSLHLIGAYAGEHGIALGQTVVPAKAHEPRAVPGLLDGLDLKGCLVTFDAAFCHHDVAHAVRAKQADFLVCLKGNQGRRHAEVRDWFATNCFAPGAPFHLPQHDTFDDTHGRRVRRRVFVTDDLSPFPRLADWPGVRAVVAVETIGARWPGSGRVGADIRHFVTSAVPDAARLGSAIRRHWAIESGLNWVMDVVFDEDRCRVRDRHAARNFAALRRLALNLARAETTASISLRRKRKRAAWDDSYMATLIQADLVR